MSTPQPTNDARGYNFLAVRSAEGRRAPGNREVSAEKYESSREAILKKLSDRREAQSR
ncbi:hypothetical protein ACEXOS_005440 [Herbiconiux sp. P16]|uniref:hypothetical protein n=1 Tax=Herbiconiux wuyangfengii TaxID=3342794 RepID=UPI0035B90395